MFERCRVSGVEGSDGLKFAVREIDVWCQDGNLGNKVTWSGSFQPITLMNDGWSNSGSKNSQR